MSSIQSFNRLFRTALFRTVAVITKNIGYVASASTLTITCAFIGKRVFNKLQNREKPTNRIIKTTTLRLEKCSGTIPNVGVLPSVNDKLNKLNQTTFQKIEFDKATGNFQISDCWYGKILYASGCRTDIDELANHLFKYITSVRKEFENQPIHIK